jgi:hypothetical protein
LATDVGKCAADLVRIVLQYLLESLPVQAQRTVRIGTDANLAQLLATIVVKRPTDLAGGDRSAVFVGECPIFTDGYAAGVALRIVIGIDEVLRCFAGFIRRVRILSMGHRLAAFLQLGDRRAQLAEGRQADLSR